MVLCFISTSRHDVTLGRGKELGLPILLEFTNTSLLCACGARFKLGCDVQLDRGSSFAADPSNPQLRSHAPPSSHRSQATPVLLRSVLVQELSCSAQVLDKRLRTPN